MRPLALVLAGLTIVAACSSDGGGGGGGGSGSATATTTTTTTAPVTVGSAVERVDRGRIEATLRAVVGERASAEQRANVRHQLRAELEAAGVEVREEPFGDGGVNVLGRIAPTGPGAGTVLVGAHYDTVPGSPGADDNGSGVAAVLEAARALADAPPRLGITFAFFDLEELGLLGSRHHVAHLPADDGPLAAAFNLDMVGFSCTRPGCQFVFPDVPNCMDVEGARDVGIGIAVVADAQSAGRLDAVVGARDRHEPDLHLGTARLQGHGECLADTRRSDHAPLWDAGIPTVFFTDTANFRNPNYHEPSDTLETLDVELVASVTRLIVAAAATAAGVPDGS